MGQSLAAICVHIVFSTQDRHPHLAEPGVRKETHAYIGGIVNNQGSPLIEIGGVADHVHILVRLGKTTTIADIVKEVKRSSTTWLKQTKGLHEFAWQAGYGAFSISQEHVPATREYIKNQEEHHRKVDYQEEFLQILREHGIEWDDRFIWK